MASHAARSFRPRKHARAAPWLTVAVGLILACTSSTPSSPTLAPNDVLAITIDSSPDGEGICPASLPMTWDVTVTATGPDGEELPDGGTADVQVTAGWLTTATCGMGCDAGSQCGPEVTVNLTAGPPHQTLNWCLPEIPTIAPTVSASSGSVSATTTGPTPSCPVPPDGGLSSPDTLVLSVDTEPDGQACPAAPPLCWVITAAAQWPAGDPAPEGAPVTITVPSGWLIECQDGETCPEGSNPIEFGLGPATLRVPLPATLGAPAEVSWCLPFVPTTSLTVSAVSGSVTASATAAAPSCPSIGNSLAPSDTLGVVIDKIDWREWAISVVGESPDGPPPDANVVIQVNTGYLAKLGLSCMEAEHAPAMNMQLNDGYVDVRWCFPSATTAMPATVTVTSGSVTATASDPPATPAPAAATYLSTGDRLSLVVNQAVAGSLDWEIGVVGVVPGGPPPKGVTVILGATSGTLQTAPCSSTSDAFDGGVFDVTLNGTGAATANLCLPNPPSGSVEITATSGPISAFVAVPGTDGGADSDTGMTLDGGTP